MASAPPEIRGRGAEEKGGELRRPARGKRADRSTAATRRSPPPQRRPGNALTVLLVVVGDSPLRWEGKLLCTRGNSQFASQKCHLLLDLALPATFARAGGHDGFPGAVVDAGHRGAMLVVRMCWH
jgi:hypothetical protein